MDLYTRQRIAAECQTLYFQKTDFGDVNNMGSTLTLNIFGKQWKHLLSDDSGVGQPYFAKLIIKEIFLKMEVFYMLPLGVGVHLCAFDCEG